KCPDDFMVSKLLGEDEDSTVVLAQDISTGKQYAIKILDQEKLAHEDKLSQVQKEQHVISRLKHPFFVKLHYTFEDEKRLYFVLSYAKNGELLSYIEANTSLPLECARFYAAELVLALEYLHRLRIIHRDLKPENILLTDDMHIQITDFGTAKLPNDHRSDLKRTTSFVGTAEYVPPELLTTKRSCISSDLWALGCIIYQMLSGKTPFHDDSEYYVFQKIVSRDFRCPVNMDTDAQDLIGKLLVVDPDGRLGSAGLGGFDKLKSHPFFRGINWQGLHLETPPMMGRPSSVLGRSRPGSENSISDILTICLLVSQTFKTAEDRLSPSKGGTMRRISQGMDKPMRDPDDVEGYGLSLNLSEEEKQRRLTKQADSQWNKFANGRLILKHGELDKKRGLSLKVRHFLLIEGPRIVYADPSSMEIKGEIPWSKELVTEVKTFKVFLIHVPGRTYHLTDKRGNAIKWCRKIEEV
uniref:3-phosphoinositide-dependent protein kinase 1 n=1 Tax=Ciona savignyi TaxID=51511 RepID=H2Z6B1_CIOSA